MKSPRPVVLLIASLFATSNAFAIGSDAVASGAAANGISASAPPVPPLPSIVGGIDAIAALIPQATAQQVDLTVPGIGEMQSGKAGYASGKPACSAQQLSAETMCREKTNPDLQKNAMLINGLVSGMNAINDSCSTSSKVMALASGALTAYTVTCGALRFRCEKTCTTTVKALAQIKAGLAKGAACKPINPLMAAACTSIMAQFNTQAANIQKGLVEEGNIADVTTVAGRTKMCTHEYLGLLASAGLGIMSVAKTFAQTSNCDKDSKAESGGSASGSATSSTSSTTGSSSAAAATNSSSTSPTPVGTVPPSSEASVNFAGNASEAGAVSSNGEAAVNDAKIGLAANSKSQERGVAADNPYRAFLPGGEKDPNKGQAAGATNLVTPREITSANGKNNFEKIRESFRKQSKSLIYP